jgi:hypothetical protein
MKQEDYKDGLKVTAKGAKGIAAGIERCNDGKFVVHVAFPGRESQWRVPIEQVEVRE